MSDFSLITSKKSILEPTGPYQVGLEKFDLCDEYRKDLDYPNGRLIPIQIYFPKQKGDHNLSQRLVEMRRPQVFSPIVYNVYSQESKLSFICEGKHPVVILNHGFTAAMTDYATIMEDLASHGYIVVTIQHQLYTDEVDEPDFWQGHSISLHNLVINNLLYVFNWLQKNQKNVFNGHVDCKRVGLIGHSLGSNALLLLSNRTQSVKETRTLLPHKDPREVKECIMIFDFDVSFSFPASSQYQVLFLTSEERENKLRHTGIYDEVEKAGHKLSYYKGAKHISLLDHTSINPDDPCAPGECYYNGSKEERVEFFNKVRKDILSYLQDNGI